MGKDGLRAVDASLKVWIGNVAQGVTKDTLEAHFASIGQPSIVELMPRGTACIGFSTADEVKSAISVLNGSDLLGQAIQVDAWYKEKTDKQGGGGGGSFGKWGGKGMGMSMGMGAPWQPQFDKSAKGGGKWGWGGGFDFGGMGWGGKGWGGGGGCGWGGKGGCGGGGRKQSKVQNPAHTVWLGGIPDGVSKEEIQVNFAAAGTVKMVELMKQGKEGFVIFSSAEEATKAIAMFNGAAINGAAIQVDVWTTKTTA